MGIVFVVIQVFLIFALPFAILAWRNNKIIKLMGPISLAYLVGLLYSLIVFLINKSGLDAHTSKDLGEISSYVAIAIAIVLLLFNSNIRNTLKLSKTVLLSFISLTISAIVVSISVFFIFGKNVEYGADLSGMAVGLYTGGTPNLNTIASILKVDPNVTAFSNVSDIIIGGVFYVFLLLAAKPLLKRFLGEKRELYLTDANDISNFEDISEKPNLFKNKQLWINFAFSILLVLVSAGCGLLVWLISGQGTMIDLLVPFMLGGATIFGIIFSFNKKISSVKENTFLGQYLILVFSLALSTSIDYSAITVDILKIFVIFAAITIFTFIIHIFVSKLLKTDVDCAIITAVAGIYGPAFVPAIAHQLKNDDVVAPGLICGSVGYAIGTFLGIGIAFFLRLFI